MSLFAIGPGKWGWTRGSSSPVASECPQQHRSVLRQVQDPGQHRRLEAAHVVIRLKVLGIHGDPSGRQPGGLSSTVASHASMLRNCLESPEYPSELGGTGQGVSGLAKGVREGIMRKHRSRVAS